jgi:hypothetical protein
MKTINDFKVIEFTSQFKYEKSVNYYLKEGYQLEVCNCGVGGDDELRETVYQAIMIKYEEEEQATKPNNQALNQTGHLIDKIEFTEPKGHTPFDEVETLLGNKKTY